MKLIPALAFIINLFFFIHHPSVFAKEVKNVLLLKVLAKLPKQEKDKVEAVFHRYRIDVRRCMEWAILKDAKTSIKEFSVSFNLNSNYLINTDSILFKTSTGGSFEECIKNFMKDWEFHQLNTQSRAVKRIEYIFTITTH